MADIDTVGGTIARIALDKHRDAQDPTKPYLALQRNAVAPNGAWDYHDKFIPNSERKPIRIWLHVSGNDTARTRPLKACATGSSRTIGWPMR